jgi:hypothetical protein
MNHPYRNCALILLTLALTAAYRSAPHAGLPESITIEVGSVAHHPRSGQFRGEPVEFAVVALGGDLKRKIDLTHRMTPFTVVVEGREAYAMFQQTGGTDMLSVEVRVSRNKSCQANAPVSFIVVRDGTCGAGYMPLTSAELRRVTLR